MLKINKVKSYAIWFIAWLSTIGLIAYAADSWTIWTLFEKLSDGKYSLVADTVWSKQITDNSIQNEDIAWWISFTKMDYNEGFTSWWKCVYSNENWKIMCMNMDIPWNSCEFSGKTYNDWDIVMTYKKNSQTNSQDYCNWIPRICKNWTLEPKDDTYKYSSCTQLPYVETSLYTSILKLDSWPINWWWHKYDNSVVLSSDVKKIKISWYVDDWWYCYAYWWSWKIITYRHENTGYWRNNNNNIWYPIYDEQNCKKAWWKLASSSCSAQCTYSADNNWNINICQDNEDSWNMWIEEQELLLPQWTKIFLKWWVIDWKGNWSLKCNFEVIYK